MISQRNFLGNKAAQAESFRGCTSSFERKIKPRKLCIKKLFLVIDETELQLARFKPVQICGWCCYMIVPCLSKIVYVAQMLCDKLPLGNKLTECDYVICL